MGNNPFLLVLTLLPVRHPLGKCCTCWHLRQLCEFGLTLSSLIDSTVLGGLLCMHVESGIVSAGTPDFLVRVGQKLWIEGKRAGLPAVNPNPNKSGANRRGDNLRGDYRCPHS